MLGEFATSIREFSGGGTLHSGWLFMTVFAPRHPAKNGVDPVHDCVYTPPPVCGWAPARKPQSLLSVQPGEADS